MSDYPRRDSWRDDRRGGGGDWRDDRRGGDWRDDRRGGDWRDDRRGDWRGGDDRRGGDWRRNDRRRRYSRSPPRRRSRSRSRSRDRDRDRRRSRSPRRADDTKSAAAPAPAPLPPPPADLALDAPPSDAELAAMAAAGLPAGFASTAGEHVDDEGANAGGIKKERKRKARQYMNRKGGFNRLLPAEKTGEVARRD